MLDRFRALLARYRRASHATGIDRESDIAFDPHTVNTRATGGSPTQHGDSAATTGTGLSALFVGRVAGEDLGYCQTTGAEVRAEYLRRTQRPAQHL